MSETEQQQRRAEAITMGELRSFIDSLAIGDDALVLLETNGEAPTWRPMVEAVAELDSDGNHIVYLWHSAAS